TLLLNNSVCGAKRNLWVKFTMAFTASAS
ncbi:ahpC/TSA family protein, partial [Vibrio parahaemolyticus V-223/04]